MALNTSSFRFTMVMDIHDWDSIQIETDILSAVSCQVLPLEFSNDEELIATIRDADAILPRYVNIQRHHIDGMTRCKIIARSGIGVDIVDVEAATQRGIWVTNVPRYCEEEVADHAVALILACVRKLNPYQNGVQQANWKWQSGKPIRRLSESTFGLIGFGKIGRLIWDRMRAFGCHGLIFDPYIPESVISAVGAQKTSLGELLKQADIIHIQSPLTTETYHLIGARELNQLKPNAIITNTARGPIIDEQALYQAIVAGKIAAAGLDDLEEEPAKIRGWKPDNPLIHLPNVIITPHTAWYSEQAAEEVKRISATEIARVLTGQRPLYPVNELNFGRK
jgi:D-3-phosphoglycerate dehydrogenase / 2-oxoglutarate reductase